MTPPPAAAAATPVRAPRPRRVSGPARPNRATRSSSATGVRTRAHTPARGGALALPLPGIRLGLPAGGLLEALAGITEHRLLDRLIRGRGWIGLVAFALIGIVAMQLWIVKLGVGIGRALEHEAFLQRENAALSVQNARESAGERVEALASAHGMVASAPGSVRFDTSRGALDARLAVAVLARDEQARPSSTASTSESTAATSTSTTSTSTTSTAAGEGAGSSESSTAESESAASGESATTSGEAEQTTSEAGSSETSTESTGTASSAESATTAQSSGSEEATVGG